VPDPWTTTFSTPDTRFTGRHWPGCQDARATARSPGEMGGQTSTDPSKLVYPRPGNMNTIVSRYPFRASRQKSDRQGQGHGAGEHVEA
jgi:hypothetical protein